MPTPPRTAAQVLEMQASSDVFRLDDVTFVGDHGRTTVSRLSLSAKPGSATALVGHVGGGKTTVLRLLAALVVPQSGSVRVFDTDLATLSYEELRRHRMRVGYSFESTGLVGNMSIGENIALPLRYHYLLGERADEKVKELALELEIEDYLDEPCFRVNGSVRKRALTARALALEPKLLLCDEPQVGLTRREACLVSDAIDRRRLVNGLSVVFADHDGYLDPFVVSRTFYLENGRLLTAPSMRPRTDREVAPLPERLSLSTDLIYRGS
ncbi:MAG TPA: ATP-binding cassette domain-containing protein [Polyangiaceae bacterium]|nr:ATP-binding cassette domain-containing protein [Polyangiaceae bacterium]